jgi:hypothetical protein
MAKKKKSGEDGEFLEEEDGDEEFLEEKVEEVEEELDLEKLNEFFKDHGGVVEIGTLSKLDEGPVEDLEQEMASVPRLSSGDGGDVDYRSVESQENDKKLYENSGPSEIEAIGFSRKNFEFGRDFNAVQPQFHGVKINPNPWERNDINLKSPENEFGSRSGYESAIDVERREVGWKTEKRKYEIRK